MAIFLEDSSSGKLKKLNSYIANKEKDIQTLIEKNLLEVLDMHFLASEYVTTFGGRIDTLAVDRNGAPVIIEYKRNQNDNIINQGLSYLRWLQAQKVEFFEMLILKKLGEPLANIIKVDWKNPRVICVAESYSKFDIDTVEVIPMRIELFKYRYYENRVFQLEALGISEQTSSTSSNANPGKASIDISVDELLKKADKNIAELFGELRSRIFELDENIIEKATTMYVAYRVAKNFAEIHIGRNQVKIHLRPLNYDDLLNKVEKIPDGYQWTLDRRIYLKEKSELDYVYKIIEQSYKDTI